MADKEPKEPKESGAAPDPTKPIVSSDGRILTTEEILRANLRDAAGNTVEGIPRDAEEVDPATVPPEFIIGTVEWVVAKQAERGITISKADARVALDRGYTIGSWAGLPNYECVLCPNVRDTHPGPFYGKITPATASIDLEWLLDRHITEQHATHMPLSEGESYLYDAQGRLFRLPQGR